MKAIAINIANAGNLNFFIVPPALADARHVSDELHTLRSVEIGLFMVHPSPRALMVRLRPRYSFYLCYP